MNRMPGIRAALDSATGAAIAWIDTGLLDIIGPIHEETVRRLLTVLPAARFDIVDVPHDDPLFAVLPRLGWSVCTRHVEVVRHRPT